MLIGSLSYSLLVVVVPKPPLRTSRSVRFIAAHMSSVRIIPEAPTNAPATIKIMLFTINPADIAAIPDSEFKNAMTTGISAPPITATRMTPAINATKIINSYKKVSISKTAGIILTLLMCAAMNRTLLDVLKGGFGTTTTNNEYDKDPISTSPEDVAIQLSYAESVVIVPGYGMAVAQAQAAVKELTNTLKDKNIEVKFAIHPVAGRMPGHMNVLLAEVDIDYEDMFTLEDINSEFSSTDVVLVLGANDVVNPLARTDKDSPIYGMPILDVDLAKQVIVIKRSMSPGYAGIANPLFINENAKMLFADAKEGLENIIKSFELV